MFNHLTVFFMRIIKSNSNSKGQHPSAAVVGAHKSSIGRAINFDIQAGSKRYVCACISEK